MDLRLTALPAALALALLASWPAEASATHVQCGDTITADTKLNGDLVDCPGFGIVIGADNITLDLNGHTVDGAKPAPNSGITNSTAGPRSGVTIKNGTVQGFEFGVPLHCFDCLIRNLIVRTPPYGGAITIIFGDRNTIASNEVSGAVGVQVQGRRNIVRGNTAVGEFGVNIWGDDNLVTHNSVTAPFRSDSVGILVEPLADNNEVIANEVSGANEANVEVRARFGESPSGNQIVRNHLSGGFRGIWVTQDSRGTLLEGNTANGNRGDGITVEDSATTVTKNTANDNGLLGVNTVEGTVDGDGNKASGNGNPLQCLNVFCK